MNVAVETAEINTESCNEGRQLYTVEEVFDRIDNKFVDFYGEYGRKIVNARRSEWKYSEIQRIMAATLIQ